MIIVIMHYSMICVHTQQNEVLQYAHGNAVSLVVVLFSNVAAFTVQHLQLALEIYKSPVVLLTAIPFSLGRLLQGFA